MILLLTDDPGWCQPLADTLVERGAACRIAELQPEAEPPQDAGIIGDCEENPHLLFNRVSARADTERPGAAWLTVDILRRRELRGWRVLNGSHCHAIAISKVAQQALLERLAVSAPRAVQSGPGETAKAIQKRLAKVGLAGCELLLKPDAGGFGEGIQAIGPAEGAVEKALSKIFPTQEPMLLQERLQPADGCIHRLELIGEKIVYDAAIPVLEGPAGVKSAEARDNGSGDTGAFNYCLASIERRLTASGGGRGVELTTKVPESIRQAALEIAEAVRMDVGGLEYLIDAATSSAHFFDINPVSSYFPDARKLRDPGPLEQLADWLIAQERQTGPE